MKNNVKETAKTRLAEAHRTIERIKKTAEIAGRLPDMDDLPGEIRIDTLNNLEIQVPWDNATVRSACARLLEDGWAETYNKQYPDAGTWRIVFRKDGDECEIYARNSLEGSTCVITKIGEREELRTVPVYEVTCPEGAEEGVFA